MAQKKRKYTKRNQDYWNNKNPKVESGAALGPVRHGDENWEGPLDTMSNEDEARIRRGRSIARVNSSVSTSRQNRIGQSALPNKFVNIDGLNLPYYNSKGSVNISDAVSLCQKAYAHVGTFRNAIDVMTEFSNADTYLTGGNKQSRLFIEKWLEKVSLSAFSEQFFREYYRSGNVFIYKFEGSFSPEDIKNLKKMYSDAATKLKLPVRYTIFDPKDIVMTGASSLDKGLYKKVLSAYELIKIKSKATPEDREVYNSLPKKVRDEIDKGAFGQEGISIDLDTTRLSMAFYKKQDYEPFAIPFGFCVLDDIDHKIELKKSDRAISRTIQQVVLLVTMGNEPEKHGINGKAMAAMREMLKNETVGRTIVSDYTTKGEFIIPDIGDILNPKKYEIVNADIQEGLQNFIFSSGEKFANQNIKVEVFLERLKEGRKIFINKFLQPQIRAVCKAMGFKSIPKVKFQDVDLKDDTQVNRIYIRLLELGIITAPQAFKAMETGILPTQEEIGESQEKYTEDRKKGYYNPLVGGQPPNAEEHFQEELKVQKDQIKEQAKVAKQNAAKPSAKPSAGPNPNSSNNGRPAGTKAPQTTKNVGPIGTSKANKFSIKDLKTTLFDVSTFISKTEAALRRKYQIKELQEEQKSFAFDLAENIINTRSKGQWDKEMRETIKDPESTLGAFVNNDQTQAIDDLAVKFNVDTFQASLLYHSKWQGE